MAEYEIYALKYAGPFKSSGAFLMWFKEWERVVERNYYIWMQTYDKLRSKASSIDLIFPGHDPLMTSAYPRVKKDITRLA